MSSVDSKPLLADDDLAYLESTGWSYDMTLDDQLICLVIRDYPLPGGYVLQHADLLLRLPPGFPDAAPDMFWFFPEVRYADGSAPNMADQEFPWDGRVWQRWSRHLATAWRPGIDNLQTYLRLIRTDLQTGTRERDLAA